jgi:hypothetical protein
MMMTLQQLGFGRALEILRLQGDHVEKPKVGHQLGHATRIYASPPSELCRFVLRDGAGPYCGKLQRFDQKWQDGSKDEQLSLRAFLQSST